jgi:hypothetical protein
VERAGQLRRPLLLRTRVHVGARRGSRGGENE